MTAVRAGDVEAALRRLGPPVVVALIYGPDTGLVTERAKAAAERAVDDPTDPFQVARLEGDAVAADPARLADEAGTIGLFGSRRAIWVRATARNLAPAVAPLLDMPVQDTLVVIEAGDLQKSSPLRTLCERSPKALALPCYGDVGRDLGAVVDEAMRAASLTLARDAREALLSSLGGDRLATRAEIAKLALYVHGRREVTLDDVDAVLSDVSSLAMDQVVDAAFSGDRARIDQGYRRLAAEGTAPSAILGGALRHGMALLSARAEIDAGRGTDEALRAFRGLHFRRQDAVRQQLGRWTGEALRGAVAKLQAAVLESRRSAVGEAVASRALFEIAAQARAGR
ncbi:MAG TPA: DNA polymerase III subunit delta [Beijerinckiaceae bacterium]|jgi:DNA polymerase-3 subunit delta